MLIWNLAVIDLVVMRHLFRKFPDATSGQLSAARSRAVCGPTLASVAVNRLGLHKHLLINNVELSTVITRHVPLLETLSPEDAILKGWKYDPPKVLSDVLESLVGAVLVDSAYNFEKTASVVEVVMSDVLEVLTTTLPRDPVSELMVWAATGGCKRIAFQQVPHIHRLTGPDKCFLFLVEKVRAMRNSDETIVLRSLFTNSSSRVPLQQAIFHCQKALPPNEHVLSWVIQPMR